MQCFKVPAVGQLRVCALQPRIASNQANFSNTTIFAPRTASARGAVTTRASPDSATDFKLAVGDNVAAVSATLTTEDERSVVLADLVQEQGAVIFMYPKAGTSGCTVQACNFGDNYAAIREQGFDVYGLSFDEPAAQKEWQAKHSLPYHLLTDSDGAAIKAFGAFKEPRNVTRSQVVIAKGGEVKDILNGVSSGDSLELALAAVQAAK